MTDAAFRQQTLAVNELLHMCRSGADPDVPVVSGIRVRTHMHPQQWFARHPSAVVESHVVSYKSGNEMVTHYVAPMLKRAGLANAARLLQCIRSFVDTQLPRLTHAKCHVLQGWQSVEVYEALFFAVGGWVWSLEYQEMPGPEQGPQGSRGAPVIW